MPTSSLFLMSSTTLLSALSLFSAATAYGGPSAATPYALDTSYSGDSFYTGWDFWTEADPTHGFVTYLDEEDAQDAGLLKRGPSGSNIIGVDSTNTYDYNVSYYGVNGLGRPSVRISTQKTWNHGLFIADIANMPGGVCGTWPAFWTLGDGTWPYHGEIDILEGANNQANVLTSLHTAGTCTIAGSDETGSLQASNCTYDVATGANSAGCGVSDPDTSSFGLQFNSNRGGVYAMEWTSEAIKVWFWPRSSIPINVLSGRPDPSTWGLPDANMAGSCDIDSNFQNHQIVIDNTFCGDWAGNTWGDSCQAATGVSTCAQYVGENPSAFSNMYWDINSINVYTATSASSTTSSCTTTTPSYTTPTVSTTLSTTTRGPYTTPATGSWSTSTTSVPFQNMTWGTTTQTSSSSVSSPLKSVAPQGSLVGVPMGGGVGITRTVSGHGFSRPTNTVNTWNNAGTGSSTAAYWWKPSSASSSTAAYGWKPTSSVSSSTASISDDGQDWSNWASSETSSTFTSTITLDPVWPDWTSSSSSVPTSSSSWDDWSQSASSSSDPTSASASSWVDWSQSTSSSSISTTSSSSWVDWSQSSTVTIAVSTLTVSPIQYSATPAAATYDNAWSSGSSSTVLPIAAAAAASSSSYGASAWPSAAASSSANAWSSAGSPASYNANSTTSAWVAAYTGAAPSKNPVAIAASTIFMAVIVVVAMVL